MVFYFLLVNVILLILEELLQYISLIWIILIIPLIRMGQRWPLVQVQEDTEQNRKSA